MTSSISAVFFDLDGVLVHSSLDLAAIKRELFGDSSVFIIEGIESLPPDQRQEKIDLLLKREMEAAGQATLDPCVPDLFSWLETRGIKRGIITRNTRDAVNLIIRNHKVDFGVIIAREDAPPKPDPESVLTACRLLDVNPEDCVMVGDFTFDIEAGRNAGCRTVFLETEKFRHLEPGADVRITSLCDLVSQLEEWL